MRVRHIIATDKTLQSDSGWMKTDMQPRHAPIYLRTKPIRAGWQWRSGRCLTRIGSEEFILLAECQPARDNWKAVLIKIVADGSSVVGRFEFHGTHPGVHLHAHCDRGGVEVGASGMDKLARFPAVGETHRRTTAWTEKTFWEAAKRFFRVADPKGPLL